MAHFESQTSVMVLDQINNPGGSLFYMYSILSHLTDHALALPKHRVTLTEEDAAEASETLAKADAGDEVPPDERPSSGSVAYSRFVLSEVEAGRGRPTEPVYLFGMSEIVPDKNRYTNRIVVLINELDFSAGEFLAAILQDNKRATLFGRRTAGAGGCVRPLHMSKDMSDLSKQFRIAEIGFRWTLALRTNGKPIEGLGVDPDVTYSITQEDIRSGYSGYRRALLATVGA
jgi:hypothetical protein